MTNLEDIIRDAIITASNMEMDITMEIKAEDEMYSLVTKRSPEQIKEDMIEMQVYETMQEIKRLLGV